MSNFTEQEFSPHFHFIFSLIEAKPLKKKKINENLMSFCYFYRILIKKSLFSEKKRRKKDEWNIVGTWIVIKTHAKLFRSCNVLRQRMSMTIIFV